jgi:hypothetical protein
MLASLLCFIRQVTQHTQGKGNSGLKPATAVNVRHILCEKHSKALEALAKIQVRSVRLCYDAYILNILK